MIPSDMPLLFDPAETVTCRAPRLYWALASFPAVYGAIAAYVSHMPTKTGPPSAADTRILEALSFCCLLIALAIGLWLIRACVIGDQTGLRWRGMGSWKSAGWDEVRDYYEKVPTRQQRQYGLSSPTTISVIQTGAGKVGVTNLWSSSEALRELVQGQAIQAVTHEWGILGSRPCDAWPHVFRYDTRENRWTPYIVGALFLTALGYGLAAPVSRTVGKLGTAEGTISVIMLGVLLLPLLAYGILPLMIIARYREAGCRRGEHITTSLAGIIFEDGARKIEAVWADVTGYSVAYGRNALMYRYVVETRQGQFDFLYQISDALLLTVIIQRYAAQSADKKWQMRGSLETLGGEAAQWSSGRVGVGAKVYHYCTRTNRALLWLLGTFCVTMLALAPLSSHGLTNGGSPLGFLLASLGIGLILGGGWHMYRTCRIETDEDSLTQITPLGRRRLLWEQIEECRRTTEGNGIVTGHGQRLWFGKGIVGCDELQSEITRRATGCNNHFSEDGSPTKAR